ncbi:MAG: c-type cytochrome, partial [Anaerolineae bacterium]|nr:c-type cytochrome [Anaerolineae bacterium]
MKVRHIFTLVLMMLVIAPIVTQAQSPDGSTSPLPDRPPSVTGGQQLWAENCLPCHGSTGRGDGPTAQAIDNPVPNFADPASARQMVPADSFDIIKNGNLENLMPPWGNRFSDKQMWDLTALVWFWGTDPADLTAGEAIYAEQCAACHGEGGGGDGPQAPANIVDLSDLAVTTQVSQAEWQAGYTSDAPHRSLALSEAELQQVLSYIRTFSFALPARDGVLTGQALNVTLNEPLANTEVTLRVFNGSTEVDRQSATTDAEGNYVFANLAADPGLSYQVESRYQDVLYESDLNGFVPDSSETVLNLDVYETTSDDSALAVTQLHFIVAFTPQSINMLQIYVVGNAGQATYIGQAAADGPAQTFRFTLPTQANSPIFQDDPTGNRFIEIEQGFADTRPVLPGEEGLIVAATYDILYNDDEVVVETPLLADINAVNLLMDAGVVTLDSDQLAFVENRQIQGDAFAIYGGEQLSEGETLTLRFSNLL